MLNLAIIGDGKMGQRIKELAPQFGFKTSLIIGLDQNKSGNGISLETFRGIDVVIDFSHPDAVKTHIKKVAQLGIPMVIGTTGWYDDSNWAETIAEKYRARLVYGSNFSLGVQLYIKLAKKAGELFGKSNLFDASIHEIHHTNKIDAPSGTAITLAKEWLKGTGSTNGYVYGIPDKGMVDKQKLRITSQRTGSVFGDHTLRLNSEWDDIELTHRARSRNGFAVGALKTAIWLHKNKEHGFFLIEDIVEEVLQS
jgi:4-hydroxy-tetrahydrodipicolinate reductase